MPLNPSTRKRINTRQKAYAVLLAALLTFAAAALFVVGASAQRRNDKTPQSGGASSRRVIVGGGSETSSGSRVRITSDNPLNDYSAYRSGDRFYVVLPKSAAGGVSKGSGKGYSDVQVQQRGDSVVVSYKVQPGAKPRVEQKFNRLDVVFDVKDGGQSAQQGQQNAGLTQPPANENRNASAQQQQQQQQQAATQPKPSTTPASPNEKRPGEAASNAGQTGAANSTNNTAQPVSEQQPSGAQAQPADPQAQGATAPAGEQNASATPAETQVAQNQPPAPIAPITNPNSSTAGAETGASFATLVVNNWPVALFVALFVIGLGLVVFARRSSGHAHEEPLAVEGAAAATTTKTTKTTKLDAPRAALLKEADADADSIPAKSAAPLAAATLATTAALAPGKKNKKKKKKGKFGKGTTGLPLAEDATVEELPEAPEEELPESPEDIAAAAAAEEASAVEPETATVEAPALAPTETIEASTPAVVEDAPVASQEASAETETATETSIEVAKEALTESATDVAPEVVPEVVASDAHTAAIVSAAAAASVTSIAPAAAPDSEEVQAQTRLLLEGGSYDRSVIGSDDSMARQLIGAELLSALAGRNVERRERARSAFIEHGYFDEKTRDVREAAAPAERAAAARSLAIVGERSAAPHLIAALGDDSMEVRRAAVEALGALREPAAVEPLEELLGREKKQRNRIPERIIRHAAETCRIAASEEARAAERARAEAEAASITQAAVVTETIEEAAPRVEEIPTQAEEVSTATTEIEPVAEESALPFESSTIEIEPAPAESQTSVEVQPVEEPSHVAEPEAAPAEVSLEAAEPHEPAREVGIAPVTEFEESAPAAEVKELAPASEHADVAAAESNAVEPFFATPPPVLESAVAEPEVTEETSRVAEESAAATFEEIESTTAVAPFVSSGEREETARAGEWVEFDVNDLGAAETAAAPPTAAEPFFELSSGEVMSAAAEVESHAAAFEPAPAELEDETRAAEPASDAREVEEPAAAAPEFEFGHAAAPESAVEPASNFAAEAVTAPLSDTQEKGVVPFNENSTVPAVIQQRLTSRDAHVRAAAITELSHVDSDEAFQQICSAFDDESKEVRSAAARALYELRTDRAESFTRALREAGSERRRNVGAAISASGLAGEAISQLTGESRDKTYEAFSLLFLMAKAGEVQPLVRAIEGHPNNEVRLAVVKLLALSGQKEILPAFRRLAVRGSLPTEVRSAVMEAIYQISSSQPTAA